MVVIALYQPDNLQNTGTILRPAAFNHPHDRAGTQRLTMAPACRFD